MFFFLCPNGMRNIYNKNGEENFLIVFNKGRNVMLPCLPTVPGDEGVGDVVEVGRLVGRVKEGHRVVMTSRLLGTWRNYGIFSECDVHIVSNFLPLPEASTLTLAPCMAYRMLKDYKLLKPGQYVIQNAANSPCGQAIIQLCKEWGVKTFNIVSSHCGYETVKEHLMDLGATGVYTLEEAEQLCDSATSIARPVLAINCLGGRYEDVMLRLLAKNGTIVYYGCAFDIPLVKQFLRRDAKFHKFHLTNWNACSSCVEKDMMIKDLAQLMVVGKFKAPTYQIIELKNYLHAFRNTVHCEAFSIFNYIFDFSLA